MYSSKDIASFITLASYQVLKGPFWPCNRDDRAQKGPYHPGQLALKQYATRTIGPYRVRPRRTVPLEMDGRAIYYRVFQSLLNQYFRFKVKNTIT